MRQWAGATQDVYSPIYVKNGEKFDEFTHRKLPDYIREVEAMEALDAALKAYDNGRGEWPTMSVSERIAAWRIFSRKCLRKRPKSSIY